MAGARFWSNPGTEPKRSFRWYFTLAGATDKLESYAIKTVKKPSFTVSEVPHQYVAHTFYYPGRVTWNTVDVTFIDPIVPDQTSILTNMLVEAGYSPPRDETQSRTSFSKEKFVTAVGTPAIFQIDAEGNVIEEWSLNNSFFTNVDFGQLDYGVEELVVNSVTIRYDYATLVVSAPSYPASKLTVGGAPS